MRGLRLNNPRFLKCLIRAVLVDGLKGFRGEAKGDAFVKLRNENPLLLEIHLPARLADGVILRCTRAVRITAAHLRCLFGDWTDFRHEITDNLQLTTYNRTKTAFQAVVGGWLFVSVLPC